MKKRIFLTALWAYVAWYGMVFVSAFFGLNDAIGPVVAGLVALVVWFAPRRMPAVAERSATATTTGYRAQP